MSNTVLVRTPGVLIQDRNTYKKFYISGFELENNFVYDGIAPDNSVHFILPDNDIIDIVENYENNYFGENPTVLIHFPQNSQTFKIDYNALNAFQIDDEELDEKEESSVAFILPTGHDLIERTPTMRPAMLQSGTSNPTPGG